MTDPKDLYKQLSADFETEKKFSFASRGDGMMQGRDKDSRRVFLINTNTQEAWELLTSYGCFSLWDTSAVDVTATNNLPDRAERNAMALSAPFHFGINNYKDGVASVSWTLQPDGIYYADEDGFGMEDDDEINFTAFIDQSANILIPFRQLSGLRREQYHKLAVEILGNR